ncbi:MAG: helix-turn-helix domain-containing protein [archaeon]|nr:helix-turn-helix domain-containing protein [archaeon]
MPLMHPNSMSPEEYFKNKSSVAKRYESIKAFFKEKMTAEEVASKFGYSVSTIYTMTKNFRKQLEEYPDKDPFFIAPKKGRPFKKKQKST